jgi:hypothetical protein
LNSSEMVHSNIITISSAREISREAELTYDSENPKIFLLWDNVNVFARRTTFS